MLTRPKYKDIRPKKGVKSLLKNVFTSAAYSEIFQGGGTKLDLFPSVIFFGRVF